MAAVYFDHNATTPVDPRVRAAMLPWLGELHGNPSSGHRFGQQALAAVEEARSRVAALVGASPPEIVFTASGTEANNAVVFSYARGARFEGHLVISALEHPSVREAAQTAAEAGMELTELAPGRDGVVSAAAVVAALRPDTRLVCLMRASNELGTLQPVAEVAAACRERGVPVLTDAVQAVGKIPVDVGELGVDHLTLGAHKFYGPLGAAALWSRSGAELAPLLVGGGQERRRRAGTVNVAAVVGLGEAARIAGEELASRGARLAALRDRLERGFAAIDDASVHCADAPRLPNTSHVAFAGASGEALMIRLDLAGFAVSTGSACASGKIEPSRALLAMGLPADEALASIRVSVGPENTEEEVDRFLAVVARETAELRRLAGASR